MPHIRSFIFLIFIGLFFITTSVVVFYVFGYRFNFDRGIFIYTGSISIKSTPETVAIRVDNELIPERRLSILNNSIHIDGLTPGEHFVEVSAEGYVPWSKKATVQSGIATEFWNVFLVKKNNTPNILPDTASVERIFQAPASEWLAVAKQRDDALFIDIINANDRTRDEHIFSLPNATLAQNNEENIEWSPDSKKIIIPVTQADRQLYFIAERETPQTLLFNDVVNTQTPYTLRWHPLTKNTIFYQHTTELYRRDTQATDTTPLLIRKNVKTYDISGKNIYYLNAENGIIYKMPINTNITTEPTQITLTAIPVHPENTYALVIYDDSRFSIREKETGKFWVYNKPPSLEPMLRTIAERGVRGSQFSNDGKKLLFFTNDEISVYFTRTWDVQPTRENDTVVQIARFSSPIHNVQWTEDYEHVLFSLDNIIKMIELDNRDRRNIVDIATVPTPITQILAYFAENILYIITTPTNARDNLSSLRLSESSGFFGL
ncbi:MAG TPA: PEGA domain-containing protein [Patescibacteria group bacterium]|nr:PEGA domain-containing protein [Patescibacteria group bacterium]